PFPENFEGHPLADGAHGAAVLEQGLHGLALHVDKAGADRLTLGIDIAGGCSVGEIAYEGNGVTKDADISFEGGMSGAVIDLSVADDGIVDGMVMAGKEQCHAK